MGNTRINVKYHKIESGGEGAGKFFIFIKGRRIWVTPEEAKDLYNQLHVELDAAFSDALLYKSIDEVFASLFEQNSDVDYKETG